MIVADMRAVLVTKHGKQRAIAPALEPLGITLEVLPIDTDAFGTFSGEIPRVGTPLDAARRKIEAGMAARPDATLFLASEGSFGPHPHLPFTHANHELILLRDRNRDLELQGQHVTTETNHGAFTIENAAQLDDAAKRIGLPSHAAIVRARARIYKGITSIEELRALVERELPVTIEADLRAMHNPTRMRAIARAAENLAEALRSACPRCARPGFVVRDARRGLPCAACGTPTKGIIAEIKRCEGCGATAELPREIKAMDPQWCEVCNP